MTFVHGEPAKAAAHIEQLVSSRRDGHGLPRDFYQDATLYARELDAIWRSGWVFVGHTCELACPGDFLTLTLTGDPLMILRDEDGRIRAFHNICTHRGTILLSEERGHARAIVCPYHQWTFSRQGALLKCWGMQDDIDTAALSLHPVPVKTCAGLIFVCLAATPPPFDAARAVLEPAAAPQGLERARVASVVDYVIQANWKVVWENNRECYHCTVNHPQYIASNFDIFEDGQHSARIQASLEEAVVRGTEAWQAAGLVAAHTEGGLAAFPDADTNTWYSASRTVLVDGYVSESMDGRRVAPLMGSYRDEGVGVLRLRTLPNFWAHASCDHAVTTRLLPDGADRTLVRVTWLVEQDACEGEDYELERLLPFWQLTSEQDWALCERVQRGVTSTAYQPGPLSRSHEYNLDAFLRWYLRQITPEARS